VRHCSCDLQISNRGDRISALKGIFPKNAARWKLQHCNSNDLGVQVLMSRKRVLFFQDVVFNPQSRKSPVPNSTTPTAPFWGELSWLQRLEIAGPGQQ